MKLHDTYNIEKLAYEYADKFKNDIKALHLNSGDDFRRNFDGVSSEE